jgi:spermidine/putrescine-binding protein
MADRDELTVQLVGDLNRGRITRREFIKRALALGLAMPAISSLLAACGAAPTAVPTVPPTSAPAPTTAPATQLEDQVNVLAWAQEWEHAVEPFQQKTGVKVNLGFETDPLETTNKIMASPGTFDVISYGPFDSPQIAAGAVQPMDISRLETWKDMHPFFQETLGKAWGDKPYQQTFYWGCTVLAYRTDVVKEELDSWSVLWDPKYKGMVCFEDQTTEAYGTLCLALGLDLNDTGEANLAKTKELALKLIPNLKTFWTTGDDVRQWMAQGEIAIAHMWDGTARMLIKDGYPVKIVYPKEKVRGWIDGPGMATDAPHPNASYAWINFVMSPEISAKMTELYYYAPANMKALDLLSPEVKELVQADQADTILKERFALHMLKDEQFTIIGDWWTQIRAETGA